MIHEGDALTVLRTLPAGAVQTCITSPPYWNLRDYGVAGQLGLEPTPDAYVAALVEVFREVRRVLRDDGTLWLNLGDSYANTGNPGQDFSASSVGYGGKGRGHLGGQPVKAMPPGLKPKDLVGIPWRVAFALQADGWYLRSDIIWAKPNPMPESVTDRPTKAHEYLFLLAKAERYFYDAEAIREPICEGTLRRASRLNGHLGGVKGLSVAGHHSLRSQPVDVLGRNRRSVWTVATQPYPEAHFATFPPDLIKPCVLAGTSERGGCSLCGAPWERAVERIPAEVKAPASDSGHGAGRNDGGRSQLVGAGATTLGWRPTCAHDAPTVPQTVLDPFAGAGTTCYVAKELGRRYVGIELNLAYIALAHDRMRQGVLPFPA